MEPFRERLWKRYMKLKGFEWNGYSAPEQCPDVASKSTLALAEMTAELEEQVLLLGQGLLGIITQLEKRIEILEGLEKARQS